MNLEVSRLWVSQLDCFGSVQLFVQNKDINITYPDTRNHFPCLPLQDKIKQPRLTPTKECLIKKKKNLGLADNSLDQSYELIPKTMSSRIFRNPLLEQYNSQHLKNYNNN